MASDSFPFNLDDIKAWIIRKKDGTVVRYNLISADEVVKANSRTSKPAVYSGPSIWNKKHSGYSEWCKHQPDPANKLPIFEKDGIALYIADAPGARASYQLFDVAIDGGNALTVPGEHDLPTLYGDPGLKSKLNRHVIEDKSTIAHPATKILKIRWADRCAPPVLPSFWPELLKQLKVLQEKKGETLNVVTICQGGHGRSGTALVALTMCLTDYTPLDALTHIRALHCARAIESKDQHAYLNYLAEHLGRDADAMDAEDVKSFKERFLKMDSPFAEPYKDRVRGGKGALVAERESSFL